MKSQMLFCAVVFCVMLVLPASTQAGVVSLNFNTDGVLPNTEAANNYPGSTVARYSDGRVGDSVAGGLWFQNNIGSSPTKGYVGHYGGVPELATTDTSLPMSINARLRFNVGISQASMAAGEFYLNMRGPAGAIWLYFKYDSATGESWLGGRHANGSIFLRALPAGKNLGEFHDVAITWDPTSIATFPAMLWVDGVSIGSTYAGVNFAQMTNGYVEFGDFINATPAPPTTTGNTKFEVDWMRFGNDLVVVPEPATMAILGLGSLSLIRRRK